MLFDADSTCAAWAAWCGRFAGGLAVLETVLSVIVWSWHPEAVYAAAGVPSFGFVIAVGCARIRYLHWKTAAG
jgi:hypothetical protein